MLGGKDDRRPDSIHPGIVGWSVMRSGWDDNRRDDVLVRPPLSDEYFVFSIEELLTVEFNDIATVNDD